METTRRVAVIDTNGDKPHIDTGLEIALKLAHEGHFVDYRFIGDVIWKQSPRGFGRKDDASVPRTPQWPLTSLETARRPRWLLRQVRDFAHQNNLDLSVSRPTKPLLKAAPPLPTSLEKLNDLKSSSIDGFPVGKYLASSLITLTRNSQANPARYMWLLESLNFAFWEAEAQTSRMFALHKYDEVVLFNGRFAESGGILLAAEKFGVKPLFHERGGFEGRTYFFQDWRPHDQLRAGREALLAWQSLSETEKAEASRGVAERLKKAREDGGFGRVRFGSLESYSSASTKALVVFFTSSEDEFESVAGIEPGPAELSQFDAAIELSRACQQLDLEFIVRIHPHIRQKSHDDQHRWDHELEGNLVTGQVIKSDDGVDSYSLVDMASVVVVWQSTVGLEAVYAGKATVALSDTAYASSGTDLICISTKSISQTIKKSLSYQPDPDSAVPFAHYLGHGGSSFQFLRFFENYYLGVPSPHLWHVERSLRDNLKKILSKPV